MSRVLLITHQLDLSGACIALLNLAVALKTLGAEVCVLPLVPDGPMRQKFQQIGALVDSSFSGKFDFCIANTIIAARTLSQLKGKIPRLLCWIHESPTFRNFHPLMGYEQIPKDALNLALGVAKFQVAAMKAELVPVPVARFDNTFSDHYKSPRKAKKGDPRHSQKAFDVTLIGYIERRKGQYKLRALGKFKDAPIPIELRLNFVGAENKEVEKLLEGVNLPQRVSVVAHGRAPHQAVLERLGQTDLLLCLADDEVKPLTILEAIGTSVPVLASAIPAHLELQEEFPGLMIEADPVESLIALVQGDKEVSICDSRALERYSWGSFLARTETILTLYSS